MGYEFWHELPTRRTDLLNQDRSDIKTDLLAELAMYKYAIELSEQGVSGGTVFCKGYRDNKDYEKSISIQEAVGSPHPLLQVSRTHLAYHLVADTIRGLLGGDNSLLKERELQFPIWIDREKEDGIGVTMRLPRAAQTQMYYKDHMIEGYHLGPSLLKMMALWEMSEQEARAVWQQVINKAKELRAEHGMPEFTEPDEDIVVE